MEIDRRQLLLRVGGAAMVAPFGMPFSLGAVETDAFPAFSDAEMATRLQRVRDQMAVRQIDAILVYGHTALGSSVGQVNVQYLARYAAVIETWLVVPLSGEPTMLLSIPYHIPNALALSSISDIRWGDSLGNAIARLRELRLDRGRIGLVGPGAVVPGGPTMFHEQHVRLLAALPAARFESATHWFDELRLEKSDEEIALLRRAGAITDRAHDELFRLTRAGATPRDLRRAIDKIAAAAGATMPFGHVGAISMRKPEGYYPDFYPTDVPIAADSLIMTEMALGFGNYWAKLWGSYFVGEPDDDYRRLFTVASDVHRDLQENLRPGMTGREVNEFLEPIARAGFEQPANVLVGGWSALNHPPQMGAAPSSLSAPFAQPYLDQRLKPRQSVTLQAWVNMPGTHKGIWVGSSGVLTASGYESFNRYPVGTLRVAAAGPTAAAPPINIRGRVTELTEKHIVVVGFDGRRWDLELAPSWSVQVMHPIGLPDIRSGRFAGVISKPDLLTGRSQVHAIHMFLPGVRMGEGTQPWDRPIGSTLTQGDVVRVSGDTLLLKWAEGERRFAVPRGVPIVLINNEGRDRIRIGGEVFILGWPQPSGEIRVDAIATGPGGSAVPL